MKSREEILQSLKAHLSECEQQFELCTDENEDANILIYLKQTSKTRTS